MPYINIEKNRGDAREHVSLNKVLTGSNGNKFEIFNMIYGGEGGNGLVFNAIRQGAVGKKCAIKILRKVDDQRIDRFTNEIDVLKRLSHEHITSYYDDGTIPNQSNYQIPWVAIDLGGPSLGLHVRENGPISPRILGHIGIQMCKAIQHLHSVDMIHRDIKPANFVWTESALSERIFMIDFGLAKRIGENTSGRPFDQFTRADEFVGPAHYSSHELLAYGIDKTTKVDHRSDLFQLGRVLWFLATGVPSSGIPSKKLDPTNGRLHQLVLELSHDDPDDRLANWGQIEKILSEIALTSQS